MCAGSPWSCTTVEIMNYRRLGGGEKFVTFEVGYLQDGLRDDLLRVDLFFDFNGKYWLWESPYDNPEDPNAIAIMKQRDDGRQEHVGWVPRILSERVRGVLREVEDGRLVWQRRVVLIPPAFGRWRLRLLLLDAGLNL